MSFAETIDFVVRKIAPDMGDLRVLAAFLLIAGSIYYYKYSTYTDIPTVGIAPGVLGRFKSQYRWRRESQLLVDEGMLKFGKFGKPFKIATPNRWIIFITNPIVLNEMKAMPLDILSYRRFADQFIQSEYIAHKGLMTDAWHIAPMRKNLTEKLAKLLPEIVDEVVASLGSTDIASGDGWTEINMYPVMVNTVAKTISRVLVGFPLCRNEEYLDSVINYSVTTFDTAALLNMTPRLLQGLVARYVLKKSKTFTTILSHVGPIFEERRRQMSISDEDTPNDVFKWILQAAPPNTPIHKMIGSLLFYNISSIHTTSVMITHALFDLAENQSYQKPLLDEIENALSGGWTRQALTEMKRTDSVLRESARMNGAVVGAIMREVVTSHTFSDGTHVPKGAHVGAPSIGIHHSDKIYESPNQFDGFRFYNMRQAEGMGNKLQNVATSVDFLAFGHGLSACPGRHFATDELKVILAHILFNYEFRFKDGVTRPKNIYAGFACYPDISVSLLLRHRKDKKEGRGLAAFPEST